MTLRRLLVVSSGLFRVVEPLRRAMAKHDVEVDWFNYHQNHWFDRYVIHNVNKQAHNLRILPKGRSFFSDHPLSHLNYRGRLLLDRIDSFRPDLVLMVRGQRFTEDVLRQAAGKAMLFGWYIESEERAHEVFPEMPFYRRYFFISPGAVAEYQAKGVGHVELLRHSVDSQAYYPVACEKAFDWCFVGNWTAERQQMIEVALAASPRGAVYGKHWLKRNFWDVSFRRIIKGRYIAGDALARLYGATKVVLNSTSWGHRGSRRRSGVNMRVLEVPACRAALLTDVSEDLDTLVTPGRHVITYDSIESFRTQLARYIADDASREKIARDGYRHVVSRYSYDDIAERLLDRYHQAMSDGSPAGGGG